MTFSWRSGYRRIRGFTFCSPRSFVCCAAVFAGLFLILHLAGWRAKTSVLCGMLPTERSAQIIDGFEALAYTLVYLLAVIASPILLIAAGVLRGLTVLVARRTCAERAHPSG